MYKLFQFILDFIYPPSKEELEIRDISEQELYYRGIKSSKTEFPFIKSIFSYKDPIIKELIWQIKYKKNKKAIRCAGYALYEKLKIHSNINILLVPIPISKQRRNERGYNQSELLIDEIKRLDKNNIFSNDYSLLIRIKNIEKQTYKNRNDRLNNIQKIFKVREINKINKKIILIDDVTTTGSTINEARKSLNGAGYYDIEALTIAH